MDDLADIIVPHWTQGAPPTPRLGGPPGKPASYGQGVIVAWDSSTFENVVRFHGTELHNLPVMAGADALTFQPGDIVGVQYWAPEGGSGQYWILPRIIVPGSGAAELAISALTTNLGRAVALSVFGEAIHVAQVSAQVSLDDQDSGNTWIDLPGSPGPTISDVEISATGRALVILTARLSVETHSDDQIVTRIAMSYEVSGATSQAPSLLKSLDLTMIETTLGDADTTVTQATMSRVHIADNLNPGTHQFQAKYTALVDGSGGTLARVSDRQMQVIPF